MSHAENGLAIPRRLSDETTLEVAFEGRFSEFFQPLGLQTIGELRELPKHELPFDAFSALNSWLLRCWWFW